MVASNIGVSHFPHTATEIDTFLHKGAPTMYIAKWEGNR
jgi:hypothetical protein